jgi:hypothetical protein
MQKMKAPGRRALRADKLDDDEFDTGIAPFPFYACETVATTAHAREGSKNCAAHRRWIVNRQHAARARTKKTECPAFR